MARQTLRDFFQSKRGSSQDKVSIKISNGDVDVDVVSGESLIDFDDDSKGLLGDYINHVTENNRQPIKGGNFIGVTPNRGVYPHSNPEESTDKPFVQQGTIEFAQVESHSNSGYFQDELAPLIDKIGENNSNDILSTIKGQDLSKTNNVVVNETGEDNPVIQASQNLLIRNNRFSPTARKPVFKPNSISTYNFENGDNPSGTMQVQNEFGSFDNSKFVTNIESLKNIGKSLLLKAGGWDSADQIKDSANPDEFELVKSILSKSGMKTVSTDATESKNAFGFPADELGNSARSGRGDVSTEKLSNKYGSIFNHKLYFYGKNYEILKKQAAISFIAVRRSLEIVLDQIENLSIKSREKNGIALLESFKDVTEHKLKGKYQPDAIEQLDYLKKNLFVKTNYSYFDCVDVGIKSIFGRNSQSNNESEVSNSKILDSDASFWINIFMSVLRRSIKVIETINAFSGDLVNNNVLIIKSMRRNSVISFMNTLAIMGDAHLRSQDGKISSDNARNIRDTEEMPYIPSTRVMKTRSGKRTHLNTSWSDSNVPSAYILPLNVIGAAIDMDTLNKGTNPARGMLGSSLADKTYTATMLHGSYNRIPSAVVRELEDRLEAEYVPFYITDIRTNEVLAFNAFLTQLNDQISTSYNDASGYGRLDPVRTYGKTTRTVSFAFKLIATNDQDFDQMWYKINKLVTLFYPQYTDGDKVEKGQIGNVPFLSTVGNAVFKQPFSQVLGATPVVRVRIGDVIKSNYSRFNLSRVFGAGDVGTNLRPSSELGGVAGGILNGAAALTNLGGAGINIPGLGRFSIRDVLLNVYALQFGSPVGKIAAASKAAKALNNITFKENIVNTGIDLLGNELMEKTAAGLVNGFVNTKVLNQTINKLVDPSLASINQQDKYGYQIGSQVFLRIRPEKYYVDVEGKQHQFYRTILGRVKSKKIVNFLESKNTANLKNDSTAKSYTRYRIEIIDGNLGSIIGSEFDVTHSDLLPDYSDIFLKGVGAPENTTPPSGKKGRMSFGANSINNMTNRIVDKVKSSPMLNKSALGKMTGDAVGTMLHGPQAFMSPALNPVTRAFETNMGRGLAGTLGGVTFNWLSDDYAWETKFNSRAPIGVDISLTLTVIHDISPGIDHSGYNRAPLYNVGNIMKEVSGDPNGNLDRAEDKYNRQENKIQKRRK
jgi:hypothetical protein